MALWRPFETEFGYLQAELQRQNEEVKEEVSLASKQAAEWERQLQVAERVKSSWYRKQGGFHHLRQHKWWLDVEQRKSSKHYYGEEWTSS
jgi:hypothetical protein